MQDVFIAGAARTPMGGLQGDFTEMSAVDLGGAAIKAVCTGDHTVDEVLMGCVLPAGSLIACLVHFTLACLRRLPSPHP